MSRSAAKIKQRMRELTRWSNPFPSTRRFLIFRHAADCMASRQPGRWQSSRSASRTRCGSRSRSGLAANKFLAKIASDLKSRAGSPLSAQQRRRTFSAQTRRVDLGRRQGDAGAAGRESIRLIADIRKVSEADLFRRYGSEGGRFHRPVARTGHTQGHAIHPMKPSRQKQPSTRIFPTLPPSPRSSGGCARRSRRGSKHRNSAARPSRLKLKTADFRTITRAAPACRRRGSPSASTRWRISCCCRN